MFLAVPQLVVVMFPVPSKLAPLMVLAVANLVVVAALPFSAPVNVVADTLPLDMLTLFIVTVPLADSMILDVLSSALLYRKSM